MDAGLSPVRQARAKHRHELRTLTYLTLDQANGGVIRNLSHEGIGVQAVTAPRLRQKVRVRFELRHPRLRVESDGEVTWSTMSGNCGIRFLNLPPRMARQIDEWIFGNLLEGFSAHADRAGSMFSDVVSLPADAEDDGLMVSATPMKVIGLPLRPDPFRPVTVNGAIGREASAQLDWLSQPLSARSLVWTINSLVVVAALLLFALIFLAITNESPERPLTMLGVSIAVVGSLYWGFFQVFGGSSPGARLARLVGCDLEEDEEATDSRFR
jgi:PilZ domain